MQIEAPEEIDVPLSLLPEEEVNRLVAEYNPHYVPLDNSPSGSSVSSPADPSTGLSLISNFTPKKKVLAIYENYSTALLSITSKTVTEIQWYLSSSLWSLPLGKHCCNGVPSTEHATRFSIFCQKVPTKDMNCLWALSCAASVTTSLTN